MTYFVFCEVIDPSKKIIIEDNKQIGGFVLYLVNYAIENSVYVVVLSSNSILIRTCLKEMRRCLLKRFAASSCIIVGSRII